MWSSTTASATTSRPHRTTTTTTPPCPVSSATTMEAPAASVPVRLRLAADSLPQPASPTPPRAAASGAPSLTAADTERQTNAADRHQPAPRLADKGGVRRPDVSLARDHGAAHLLRSEERRVGKESRSRWSP